MTDELKKKIIGINILYEEFTPIEIIEYISKIKKETNDPIYLDMLTLHEQEIYKITAEKNISLEDKLVLVPLKRIGTANQIAYLTMELYQKLIDYGK